jgi:hypothetical protein
MASSCYTVRAKARVINRSSKLFNRKTFTLFHVDFETGLSSMGGSDARSKPCTDDACITLVVVPERPLGLLAELSNQSS